MKTFISIYIKNHPIVRKIKTFLFPKRYMMSAYNRNARRVHQAIKYVIDEQLDNSVYSLQITDINVKVKKGIVTITLGRPGLLIGKAGNTIDKVQEAISRYYSKNMKIVIKESYIF